MPIVASVTKRPRPRRRPRRSSPRSTPRAAAAHAASRPGVRRHPARRVRARRRRPRPIGARPSTPGARGELPDGDAVARVAKLVSEAASGRCSWPAATSTGRRREEPMRAFVEQARVPVFVNGMGRGTLPADHELAFSRAAVARAEGSRSRARRRDAARLPARVRAVRRRAGRAPVRRGVARSRRTRDLAASTAGDLAATFAMLAESGAPPARTTTGSTQLRDDEQAKRAAEEPLLAADSAPIKPTRIYGELRKRLDRDAIVIGDGGDFVSYAGKYVDSYEPGTFLDPGPFGCLGHGTGLRARGRDGASRPPDRAAARRRRDRLRARRLRGAGAARRERRRRSSATTASGGWRSTRCRRCSATTSSPSSAPGSATTRRSPRWAATASSSTEPGEIGPALDRAFATPGVSLVNVLTDPEDAYPRSSNLA